MTQLSSLQLRDGWPITHVLFRATLQWSIISVSDSRQGDSTFVDLIFFLAFIASATLWSGDATLSESIHSVLLNEFVDFLPAALRFCRDGRGGGTLVGEAKKALSVVMGGMVHVGLRMAVLDQDDATAMAYCLLFDPNQPFVSKFEEEIIIHSASAMLAASEFAQSVTPPPHNPIVEVYDASHICRRIAELLADPRFQVTAGPDSVLSHVLLSSYGRDMPWFETGVHVAFAKRAWYIRKLPRQRNAKSRLYVSFSHCVKSTVLIIEEMLKRHTYIHGSGTTARFMRELVIQCDIISLCALALQFCEGGSVDIDHEAVKESVTKLASEFRRHITGTLAELEWMTALVAFAELRRLEGRVARNPLDRSWQAVDEHWRRFGAHMGLEAPENLSSPPSPTKGTEKRGCDWARCPLWKENVIHTMLRCVQCKSAQYCSLQCQKYDWYQGKHKAQCKRRI